MLGKVLSLMIVSMIFAMTISVAVRSYGAVGTSSNIDDASFEKLLADYQNWNINVTAENFPDPNKGIIGSSCVIKLGSVNFLLDPYDKYNMPIQTCEIASGSSLLFPFLLGWCDTASTGNTNMSYAQLLNCALKSDKGIITMEAVLDGKPIINIQVDNNNYNKSKINYPIPLKNDNYKEIITHNEFDLTISNNTRMPRDSYNNAEEFKSTPVDYKAAAQCFCGYIDNLPNGDHTLTYSTIVAGSVGASKSEQDQNTKIEYKLKVR